MTLERLVFGLPIRAEIMRLDEGADVSLTGGCRTHVGAVTLAEPDGVIRTMERPGHRDSAVSEAWAGVLAAAWGIPVCVRCGIHYDNASKEQITAITGVCEEMLRELLDGAEQERTCDERNNPDSE